MSQSEFVSRRQELNSPQMPEYAPMRFVWYRPIPYFWESVVTGTVYSSGLFSLALVTIGIASSLARESAATILAVLMASIILVVFVMLWTLGICIASTLISFALARHLGIEQDRLFWAVWVGGLAAFMATSIPLAIIVGKELHEIELVTNSLGIYVVTLCSIAFGTVAGQTGAAFGALRAYREVGVSDRDLFRFQRPRFKISNLLWITSACAAALTLVKLLGLPLVFSTCYGMTWFVFQATTMVVIVVAARVFNRRSS